MIRSSDALGAISHLSEGLLDRCYEFCADTMTENSKSFSFAAKYLNEEQQRGVAALYAYCRYTDDIVDEAWLPNDIKTEKLDKLEWQIENIAHYQFDGNPILYALQDTVLRYGIPTEHLIELIKGVRMDLEITEYETIEQLNLYCYRVASIVGILMCYIAGSTSEAALERAADLGLAMQITNILRDVSRDFEMGRIYLPRELRDKFGVTIDDLVLNNESDALVGLLKHEINRAREYYRLGEEGLFYLPDGFDFSIEVASTIYSEILSEIERADYKILTRRTVVSKARKIYLAGKLKLKRIYFKSPLSLVTHRGVDLT
ncbi:MAG: phytoene/squalene synthase family protein [Candidatus Kariarchaeaceae archaeon]|jgi:phytoene synthase